MIYQVSATLYFDDPDEARDFIHDCALALDKATVINPHTQEQECSHIDLINNHHNESPHDPCYLISHRDNCPTPP